MRLFFYLRGTVLNLICLIISSAHEFSLRKNVHENDKKQSIADVGKSSKFGENPSTTDLKDDQMRCNDIKIIKSP